MLQLLYYSSASHLFETEELDELLAQARRNNKSRDITGMLLYADGSFFQVLEGPKEAVLDVYEKISQDSRHTGLISMLNQSVSKRDFPDWSMGFKRTAAIEDLPPAFFALSNAALQKTLDEEKSREVVVLMKTFVNNTLRYAV